MKTYQIIGITVGAFVAGTIVTLSILNPRNYAETSVNADDFNLRTRRYTISKKSFSGDDDAGAIRSVVKEIGFILARQKTYGRSWQVVDSAIEKKSAAIKATVPVVIFTDDLQVAVEFESAKNGDSTKMQIVVNVRSTSRVGNSDLGENRRHIVQLLEDLDFSFGNENF
ncbi:MAG: DUF1499 domain-containing protein [Pyrinomonadaceae bacterium]|nr:DUF1499 domain-containing protein [Pyrinomonadaceae bacterium]